MISNSLASVWIVLGPTVCLSLLCVTSAMSAIEDNSVSSAKFTLIVSYSERRLSKRALSWPRRVHQLSAPSDERIH